MERAYHTARRAQHPHLVRLEIGFHLLLECNRSQSVSSENQMTKIEGPGKSTAIDATHPRKDVLDPLFDGVKSMVQSPGKLLLELLHDIILSI